MNSSDKQHIMASEAQRLIGVSLAKIAQSRVSRGGVSLHKNLLVATVLQKARYVFMEEAYNIVHGHYPHQQSRQIAAIQRHHQQQQQQQLHQQQQQQLQLHYHQQQQERAKYANNQHQQQQQQQQQQQPQEPQYHHHSHRESLAAAKSSLTKQLHHQPPHQTTAHQQQLHTSPTAYRHHHHRPTYDSDDNETLEHRDDAPSTTATASSTADKENISPPESSAAVDSPAHPADQLTYLDLDTHNKLQRVTTIETSLKRRRVISESETHEAVLSILPKRSRTDDEDDDSVFIDKTTIEDFDPAPETNEHLHHTTHTTSTAPLADEPMDTSTTTTSYEEDTATDLSAYAEPMEIDRISSLVSIFNFGNLSRSPASSVNDTCSTQAHQHQPDDGSGSAASGLHHQHHQLAMSV